MAKIGLKILKTILDFHEIWTGDYSAGDALLSFSLGNSSRTLSTKWHNPTNETLQNLPN